MNKLAILCPTKGRPENLKRLQESFDKTQTGFADLFPIIDKDELDLYNRKDAIVSEAQSYFCSKLNGAVQSVQDYDFVAIIGDDVIIHTEGFDKILVDEFNNSKWQILHCEDNMHHDKFANHWIVRMELVQEFGFMMPPVLQHMFGDNFWTQIGKESNSIKFMPNILWEHLHWVNRKAKMDDTYKRAQAVISNDQKKFNEFMASEKYIELLNIIKERAK